MLTQNEPEFILQCVRGNEDAARFIEAVAKVSQVWDDLYDKDRPVADETLNRAFWIAMVDIPSNPFYQRHFEELQPIVRAGIMDWMASNDLEQGSEHDKEVAYVLRDTITGIITHCAYLVGGYNWMKHVNTKVRRALHDEPMGEYKESITDG